ncbi:MAG: hypothetical protein IKV40_00345 [Clostridia bacterium]|nr:hypothetical protein [Clostridia bacterium]
MFGYIRPHTPDLRVRENELYRAVYCGLCREMGKVTGQASRLTLSFDFVFLCLVRAMATGESFTSAMGTCIAHPFKKRQYVEGCDSLRYCAAAAAYLTEGKLRDDVADECGLKRTAAVCLTPAATRMTRLADKNADASPLRELIREKLNALSALEREGCTSIDRCAEVFGELTAEVFSFGLPTREARICAEIGRGIGRFIYVCDAVDDVADDSKKGRFNPILAHGGEDALTEKDGKRVLSDDFAEGILTAANLDLGRCAAAAELLCDDSPADAAAIIRNIIYLGMPGMLKKVTSRVSGEDTRK